MYSEKMNSLIKKQLFLTKLCATIINNERNVIS